MRRSDILVRISEAVAGSVCISSYASAALTWRGHVNMHHGSARPGCFDWSELAGFGWTSRTDLAPRAEFREGLPATASICLPYPVRPTLEVRSIATRPTKAVGHRKTPAEFEMSLDFLDGRARQGKAKQSKAGPIQTVSVKRIADPSE